MTPAPEGENIEVEVVTSFINDNNTCFVCGKKYPVLYRWREIVFFTPEYLNSEHYKSSG